MHIRWEEFMKTNDANCNILEQKQPNQVDLKNTILYPFVDSQCDQ